MKLLLPLFILLCVCLNTKIYSQDSTNIIGLQNHETNLTSILPTVKYPIELAKKYSKDKYYSNPDFGIMPINQKEGYFEVIEERTETSRFYRNIEEPSTFLIEKSLTPINYMKDGYWRAINHYLSEKENGIYTSENQPNKTILNTIEHKSGIDGIINTLYFNNVQLAVNYKDGSNTLLNANWDNYTLGSEGIYITNVFPQIDMEIVYSEATVKSTYIIKEKLPNVATAKIIDQLSFKNEALTINPLRGDTINGEYKGSLYVGGTDSSPLFIYQANKVYDNSNNKSHGFILPYSVNQEENTISMEFDSTITNNDTLVYPVYIDPTVTYGPFSATGNKFSIDLLPYYCSKSVTISFPGGSTPTDFQTYWSLHTGVDCYYEYYSGWLSDAHIWLTSSCGGVSPTGGGIVGTNVNGWVCSGGCDVSGTWNPTLPFGGDPSTKTMVNCYTPSCSAQNMTFTFNITGLFDETNCNCAQYTAYYGYEADILVDTWRVWVQGKTLETTTDQTYNVASCAGTTTLMNPLPAFGVPGYTYVWNNGATTSTINANNAQSPYSVTVTDACGAQKVVTFTVICPLSVTLNNFTAEKINRQVLLSWETASEKDNDYFLIERAGEDGVFSSIGKTKAIGNSNTLQSYRYYDENPSMGTSYYRLKIYDTQGNESISEVKSVGFDGGNELQIIPNPNKGNYQIAYHFPEKGTYLVELYSTRGEQLISNQISIDKSGYKEVKLDEVSLPTGVYFVKLYTNNQVLIEKMIVE